MATQKPVKITRALAQKVLRVVSKGLSYGLHDIGDCTKGWDYRRNRPKPGFMCVEAAVCYAMGEEHSDSPKCVAPTVRNWKIGFNDELPWNNKKERARGLRRLAIAQLGSKGIVTAHEFAKMVRAARKARADRFMKVEDHDCRDMDHVWGNRHERFALCEDVVQILKQLKSPGAKFLSLAPLPRELKHYRRAQ